MFKEHYTEIKVRTCVSPDIPKQPDMDFVTCCVGVYAKDCYFGYIFTAFIEMNMSMPRLEGMSLSHPYWRSPSLLWSTIAIFTLHFARVSCGTALHTFMSHQHRHTHILLLLFQLSWDEGPWPAQSHGSSFNLVCSRTACTRQQTSCLRATHINHRTAKCL